VHRGEVAEQTVDPLRQVSSLPGCEGRPGEFAAKGIDGDRELRASDLAAVVLLVVCSDEPGARPGEHDIVPGSGSLAAGHDILCFIEPGTLARGRVKCREAIGEADDVAGKRPAEGRGASDRLAVEVDGFVQVSSLTGELVQFPEACGEVVR
jgi:hypothetical protein